MIDMLEPSATKMEMEAQPSIWRQWSRQLLPLAAEIRQWLHKRAHEEIWLCGAGTSALIGDSLAIPLNHAHSGSGKTIRNIASTDLVSVPYNYLPIEQQILVVSFGRSGNSSESVGTIDLLDRKAPAADRLHITCNANGALANRIHPGPGRQKVVVLPDACHDSGFAMTSSYTTMLATALAFLGIDPLDEVARNIDDLAAGAETFLSAPLDVPRPERIVFLGSGPFLGTARECALKVLELSAGRIVASSESPLGFRHGPKSIIDANTMVVIFKSNNALTLLYDSDVASEIKAQFPHTRVLCIAARGKGSTGADIELEATDQDLWNGILFSLIGQRLAIEWSHELGLNTDNPFRDGLLTRVVSNVRLYE